MTIWDGGWPDQSEPEREQDWHDSEDADQSWKEESEKQDDGDDWKEESYPSEDEWGNYWTMRGMAQAEDEDDRRSRGRRKRDDEDGDGA